ncbi:late endosomal/lysosomal adaptor and MAPK and MTOR activator-domain-containing protein [Coniochaeta sp. 2T2.1]|nr:late endosomal/lysosomal adaptor and MAPK and MTOR activator-domain-containing protein [Coniochaeta sp. 2T2.1]
MLFDDIQTFLLSSPSHLNQLGIVSALLKALRIPTTSTYDPRSLSPRPGTYRLIIGICPAVRKSSNNSMGNCSSCLGRRRRDSYEEDDESRLLFDDANGMHYGSFGEQQASGQEDPQETQREIEALQRVVARTSDNMVDVYEIAPQDKDPHTELSATYYAPAGQEARMARYQTLLTKLASNDDLAGAAAVAGRIDWDAPDEDTVEVYPHTTPVKVEADNTPLVGTFAEAATAMK